LRSRKYEAKGVRHVANGIRSDKCRPRIRKINGFDKHLCTHAQMQAIPANNAI
jgi:hypothetical protein